MLTGQYDEDGSGTLSMDELRTILTSLPGEALDDTEIDEIIKDADADGDGEINGCPRTGLRTHRHARTSFPTAPSTKSFTNSSKSTA